MAKEAISNPATVLSEMDIRIWLRDTDPAANLLIDDVEFSPEEIRTAATLAVDVFNDEPPYVTGFDVYTFPYRSALLRGTAANLLFMAAHRFRRNKLQYTIPGGGVSDQNKDAEYDAAGQRLWAEYKAWIATYKRAVNIHQGWGMV
jgi:hypothetical protein